MTKITEGLGGGAERVISSMNDRARSLLAKVCLTAIHGIDNVLDASGCPPPPPMVARTPQVTEQRSLL